jgi:hypothetical protein
MHPGLFLLLCLSGRPAGGPSHMRGGLTVQNEGWGLGRWRGGCEVQRGKGGKIRRGTGKCGISWHLQSQATALQTQAEATLSPPASALYPLPPPLPHTHNSQALMVPPPLPTLTCGPIAPHPSPHLTFGPPGPSAPQTQIPPPPALPLTSAPPPQNSNSLLVAQAQLAIL